MEFQLKLSCEFLFRSKMAIALYVPPEYGPVPEQSGVHNNNNNILRNNNVVRNRSNNSPVITIDMNNNHVIPDLQLVHEVAHFPTNPTTVQPSPIINQNNTNFVHQLATEVVSVFRILRSLYRSSTQSAQNQTSNSANNADDSVNSSLPDVVQCHVLSIDLSIESSNNTRNSINNNNSNRRRRHPASRQSHHPIPLHFSQNSGLIENEEEEENFWNFELKVSVDQFSLTGRELREIADQFSSTFQCGVDSEEQRSRVHLKCVMPFAIVPTFALVGLVGSLAYYFKTYF